MSLLTPAELQALGVGEGLSTSSLQALIDYEEAEIVRRFGAHTASITEPVMPTGRSLYLRRPVSSVTSITEYLYVGDPQPATRAAADYYVWGDEGRIERAAASQGWGAVCVVVYTPADDQSLRKSVLIELVRLSADGGGVAGGEETIQDAGGRVTFKAASSAEQVAARSAQYERLGRWMS